MLTRLSDGGWNNIHPLSDSFDVSSWRSSVKWVHPFIVSIASRPVNRCDLHGHTGKTPDKYMRYCAVSDCKIILRPIHGATVKADIGTDCKSAPDEHSEFTILLFWTVTLSFPKP